MTPIYIKADKLLTGTDSPPLLDPVVAIDNGCIAAVGHAADPAVVPPAGANVVHLPGHTLLPGLIDCHVHPGLEPGPDHRIQLLEDSPPLTTLRGVEHLRRTLAAGVTTVRSLGEPLHIGPAWKTALARGFIAGPRLLVSGRILTIPGGHEDWHYPVPMPETHGLGRVISGPEEARRAAREEMKAGADVIKLCATGGILSATDEPGAVEMSFAEMQAAVAEAERTGRHAAAHAQGAEGIKQAVRAGVRSIEHGIYLDDEAIELMLAAGTFLVPTLAAGRLIVEHGMDAGIPAYAVEKAKAVLEVHWQNFARAVKAGVKVAMGTDAGTPFNAHGDNAQELELMVAAGMSPAEAIAAATSVAAALLGHDDIGEIAPGKCADMIAVPGDPLQDIGLLRDVAWVCQGGRIVKSPDRTGDGM